MADLETRANASDTDIDLLSPATAGAYLRQRELLNSSRPAQARSLAGGVSNVVLEVSSGPDRFVVKQALPRLRVDEEWLAKRERALTEAEALELTRTITPEHVPALLDLDRERCVLTIEAAPADWTTWKHRLLHGEADAAIARRLGEILATWHGATDHDPRIAAVFGDHEAFDQLRIDPYYRTVARRRPELAEAIGLLVERMSARRTCLVHGDYSPKNILVGEGIWVIDFEVVHYGDPAFDLAFMLNHLLLKRLHRAEARDALDRCVRHFWDGYCTVVSPDLLPDATYVLEHVGCLMLARIEGKSPVEYLSEAERELAWATGRELFLDPPATLAAALAVVAGADE